LSRRCIWHIMYAILHCGSATVYGWIPTWRAPSMGVFFYPPIWGTRYWEIL